MPRPLGIVTGAGISAGAPAHLPLGDEFHEQLLTGCREAARCYAGNAVTESGLRLLIHGGRRNILGCIEDSLDGGTVAGVLNCMRVMIPTEAHLLCAVHAAHGAIQATLNFDNGIELAYRLLRGDAELPEGAPTAFRQALDQWRSSMPDAGSLRVVATSEELGQRRYCGNGPVLVKLRGCVERGTDGSVVPLRPAIEDLESTRFDEDRLVALRAVADCDHLLVTGHSGRDLDCFESLRGLLRRSSFSWVVPELTTSVIARVRAIDPSQPTRGTASQALRARLPSLPGWPNVARDGPAYGRRFERWWCGVSPPAAAEAYARMLADAGRYQEATVILRALLAAGDHPRVRLRLASVLAGRGRPDDMREATRRFGEAAGDPALRAPVRAYALTRWAECRIELTPIRVRRAMLSAVACTAAALLARDRRVAVRALAGLGLVARQLVDRRPVAASRSLWQAMWLAALTRSCLAILRLVRRRAGRAGTAARQTDLELQLVGMEVRLCLLTGGRVPADTARRLAAASRAYRHRGDLLGELHVLGIRGLACLATGDHRAFRALLRRLTGYARRQAPRAAAIAAQLRRWQEAKAA